MNKALPLLAFSVLLLVPAGAQNAFAVNVNSVGTGNWVAGGTWSTGVFPAATDNITILAGHTVTIDSNGILSLMGPGSLTIQPGGTLIIGDPNVFGSTELRVSNGLIILNQGTIVINGGTSIAGGQLSILDTSTLDNDGTVTVNGGPVQESGRLITISADGSGTIDNSGTIILNGNSVSSTASMVIGDEDILKNTGTIILNGGDGTGTATLRNHNILNNDCGGVIQVNGGLGNDAGRIQNTIANTINNQGLIALNGNPFNNQFINAILLNLGTINDGGTIQQTPGLHPNSGMVTQNAPIPVANNCGSQGGDVIGGQIIPIESASLILAGAQSCSWMIPVTLSVLGIGLFITTRKDAN